MHICISKLTVIGSDNGFLPWFAPSHYLNQCWNIVNWTLGNKISVKSKFIHFHSRKCVWKMVAILSPPQCLKYSIGQTNSCTMKRIFDLILMYNSCNSFVFAKLVIFNNYECLYLCWLLWHGKVHSLRSRLGLILSQSVGSWPWSHACHIVVYCSSPWPHRPGTIFSCIFDNDNDNEKSFIASYHKSTYTCT